MINKEGLWFSKEEPHLPKPVPLDYKWKGRKMFLEALSNVQAKIDAGRIGSVQAYRGFSVCRLCEKPNGNQEYELTHLHSTWKWPSGYLHYIQAHNVRPSLSFQEFIMAVDSADIIARSLKRK